MNNRERFEYINTFNDFQRVAKYGTGVTLNGRILDKDFSLLKHRESNRLKLKNILVGDWVIMPSGDWLRVAYDWEEMGVQLCESGSFSLLESGKMSMSGSLFPMIKINVLRDTNKFHQGDCWFFSEDCWGAHRGVHVLVPCKVWEYTEQWLPNGYEKFSNKENVEGLV